MSCNLLVTVTPLVDRTQTDSDYSKDPHTVKVMISVLSGLV